MIKQKGHAIAKAAPDCIDLTGDDDDKDTQQQEQLVGTGRRGICEARFVPLPQTLLSRSLRCLCTRV